MNNKHLMWANIFATLAVVGDQLAGSGILSALGPWGVGAAAVISAGANAYVHRDSPYAPGQAAQVK